MSLFLLLLWLLFLVLLLLLLTCLAITFFRHANNWVKNNDISEQEEKLRESCCYILLKKSWVDQALWPIQAFISWTESRNF